LSVEWRKCKTFDANQTFPKKGRITGD